MPNIIWWILGLAVAGGTAFYYSDMGKKIFKKDACISELPEPKKSEVLKAIEEKNLPKLQVFAKNASDEGFICASKEINSKIEEINKTVVKDKCPSSDQVDIAVADIKSGKLTTDGAKKLIEVLDKNGCSDQKKKIEEALIEKLKSGLVLNKDAISGIFINEIKVSLDGATDADKYTIIDIIKQSQSSSVDYTKFPYDAGKVLAYADVAAKYKATKAESILRSTAQKIKESTAKLVIDTAKGENQKRAELEWPSIMALPDNDLGIHAKSAALCLHKTDDVKIYSGLPAVKMSQAIPGCAVNVDRLISTTSELESKYGSTFSEAVSELKIIINSLQKDFLA